MSEMKKSYQVEQFLLIDLLMMWLFMFLHV